MEIWCVEVKHLAVSNDARIIWIVVRQNKESEWKAVMLAAMSATWPYEACSGVE
jgi:ribosomal protein L15E